MKIRILLAIGLSFVATSHAQTEETSIKVMTYNVYKGGLGRKQPLSQTAKVIQEAKADVVGLQELNTRSDPKNAEKLAALLGFNRYDNILTRYEIVEEKRYGIKVKLPSGQEAYIFNLHLSSNPYQPYQLMGIRPKFKGHKDTPFIKTEAEAIEGAQKARTHGTTLKRLFHMMRGIDKNVPVFVVGDFNEPSHLDWTEAAAKSGRHPIKVEFPTSKAFAKVGFTDAYRTIYPDEMAKPGFTWSPAYKADDPEIHHDRIDYVYFKGEGLKVTDAKIIGENEENADIVVAPYPSDHRAVVATIALPQQPKTAKLDASNMKTQDLLFDLHLDAVDTKTLPTIHPWRSITLDPEWRGAWLVAGDVDGDGQCELVNARAHEQNDTHPIVSVCVYKLDGSILWRWGTPKSGVNVLHSDYACQIFDWNGDGQTEVIIGTDQHLIALDGASGKELLRHPIPKDANDCITFAYLDGPGKPAVAIIKNRYKDIWAMNLDGTLRWHWAPPKGERTAHQPYPIDLDGDGMLELISGFCAIDGKGRTLWSLKQAGVNCRKGHLDCARSITLDDPPGTRHLLMTLCGGNGIISVDLEGKRQWALDGLHYESIDVGRLHPSLPGPQFAVDTTHGKKPYQDPLQCIDATGRIFGQVWGKRVRQHFNIDWLGNGFEQICIPSDLMIVDPSKGTAIAQLATPQPDDLVPLKKEKARAAEHAAFGEYLYMGFCGDITGSGRQDIVVHTNPGTSVWIYENTTGRTKNRELGSGNNYTLY